MNQPNPSKRQNQNLSDDAEQRSQPTHQEEDRSGASRGSQQDQQQRGRRQQSDSSQRDRQQRGQR
jgi:hypothetical protein